MNIVYSIIVVFTFLFPLSLLASEKSHMQAAQKMVEVANVDKMLQDMYQQINTIIIQDMLTKDPCLMPIKESLTALLNKYDQKILNANIMKAEMQKLYVKEFSEEEINQIVAFHNTPAGKKALEKAPALAAKGMEIAQKEVNKAKSEGVMDELQMEIKKMIDNIDPKTLSEECRKKYEEKKAVEQKANALDKKAASEDAEEAIAD